MKVVCDMHMQNASGSQGFIGLHGNRDLQKEDSCSGVYPAKQVK